MKALFLTTFCLSAALLAADGNKNPLIGNVIKVKVGKKIERSWEEVRKAGFKYGQKQDYDSESKRTTVYLPYGNVNEFFEVEGKLIDPTEGAPAQFLSQDGSTNTTLTYRLSFDRQIKAFG